MLVTFVDFSLQKLILIKNLHDALLLGISNEGSFGTFTHTFFFLGPRLQVIDSDITVKTNPLKFGLHKTLLLILMIIF